MDENNEVFHLGFDFTGYEIVESVFNKQEERFAAYSSQLRFL